MGKRDMRDVIEEAAAQNAEPRDLARQIIANNPPIGRFDGRPATVEDLAAAIETVRNGQRSK